MALSSVARLYRFKGGNFLKEEQYEEAVKAFTKAISIEPDEIAGPSNRCTALMKLERWEEAVMDASTCLQLDPKHAQSMACKATALFHMGDYAEAIENADKAMQTDPGLRETMEALKADCRAAMGGDEASTPVAEASEPLNDEEPSPKASQLPEKTAKAVEAVMMAPAVADVAPPLDPTPTAPVPLPPASPPLEDVSLPSPEPSFASAASTSPPSPVPQAPAAVVPEEALEDERLPEIVALNAKVDELRPLMGRNTKQAIAAWTEALKQFPSQVAWLLSRGLAYAKNAELEPAIVDLTAALGLVPPTDVISNAAHIALERRAEARAQLGDLEGAARDAGAAAKRAPTADGSTTSQNAMMRYLAQLKEAKAGGKAAGGEPPAAVKKALAQGEAVGKEGFKYLELLRKKEIAYAEAARVRNAGRKRRNAIRHGGGPPPTVPTTDVIDLGDGLELLLTRLPVVYVGGKEAEKKEEGAATAAPAAPPKEAPAETDGGFKAFYDEGVRALRAKSWQDAEKAFSSAAAVAPKDRLSWCLLKRAAARLGAGYPDEALDDLEKAQKNAPDAAKDPQLWLEVRQTRAKTLEAQGRLDAAIEELEEAEAELEGLITPQQTSNLIKRTMDLLDKQTKAEGAAARRSSTQHAAAAAAAAVMSPQRPLIEEIEPETATEHVSATAAAVAGGTSAEDLAAKAEAARVLLDNATRDLVANNIEAAKNGFELASKLDPTLIDAHGKLAVLEEIHGNWAAVEAHCCAAMAAPGGEEDPHIREMRARAYLEQGRRLEALTDFSILSARFGDASAGELAEELQRQLVASGELSAEEAARLVGAGSSGGAGKETKEQGSQPVPITALLDPNFDMKTFDELESIDFTKVGPRT